MVAKRAMAVKFEYVGYVVYCVLHEVRERDVCKIMKG